MGTGSYSNALELAAKNGRVLMCQYCGEESIAIGSVGICSNCELPVSMEKEALQSNATAFAGISKVKELLEGNDYEGAAAEYNAMYKSGNDPSYLYAEALLRIKQSNSQTAGIRYDRKGFMEENAAFRDNAAKLASMARGLLNDTINACAKQINEQRPPLGMVYLAFLCHMKLSNLREAGVLLQTIEGIDSVYIGAYSRMMLDLNLHRPESVILGAERLLKPGSFSINALFYIAVALFDMKKYKEAKNIIGTLQPHLQNGQTMALASEIEAAMLI